MSEHKGLKWRSNEVGDLAKYVTNCTISKFGSMKVYISKVIGCLSKMWNKIRNFPFERSQKVSEFEQPHLWLRLANLNNI